MSLKEDALQQSWERTKVCTFPPLSLLGRALVKFREKKVLCAWNETRMTKPSMVHDPTKNVSRESIFFLIMNRPGERSVAGVIKKS